MASLLMRLLILTLISKDVKLFKRNPPHSTESILYLPKIQQIYASSLAETQFDNCQSILSLVNLLFAMPMRRTGASFSTTQLALQF